MANNRMFLRCDHCQQEVLLAKYYPKLTDGWFLPFDPLAGRDDSWIGLFLGKHSYCPTGRRTMIGNVNFSLRFEEVT
jgi:hypothetical protein